MTENAQGQEIKAERGAGGLIKFARDEVLRLEKASQQDIVGMTHSIVGRLLRSAGGLLTNLEELRDSDDFDRDMYISLKNLHAIVHEVDGELLAFFEARKRKQEEQKKAPSCGECGMPMIRNGACYKCLNCGATSGCS